MKKYYWISSLFNFVFGGLLFFVVFLWLMSFAYVADIFGWSIDPTLDEGLLFFFLILAIITSVFYFPTLIFTNIKLWKKVNLSKFYYVFLSTIMLILGFISFFSIIYLD